MVDDSDEEMRSVVNKENDSESDVSTNRRTDEQTVSCVIVLKTTFSTVFDLFRKLLNCSYSLVHRSSTMATPAQGTSSVRKAKTMRWCSVIRSSLESTPN